MLKIRKGDMVQIIAGKDAGKKGKVVTVLHSEGKVLVEALNLATKHKRQTRQDSKGGIVKMEMPLPISKVMLVCKSCNKPARVGFLIAKDGAKERVCKKCQGVL